MTYKLNLCQGLESEHIAMLGDGSSGKSFKALEILKQLPSAFKIWAWDDTHTAFNGIGKTVRTFDGLIDANVQYLPQEKSKEEMIAFLEITLRAGNRIAVLDEFHKYQNSKSIHPSIEYFLKTFKHHNGSWLVIAQSPLEMNDVIYHNMHHLFAFYMKPTSRHINKYYEWFGKPLTKKLIELFWEVDGSKLKRPYIYQGKSAREPVLYSHRGKFVVREDQAGKQNVIQLKGTGKP